MKLIDSSVIIKFFCKEEGWELAEKHLPDSATIPLAIEELGNGLWKKVLGKEISSRDAELILTIYQSTVELVDCKEYRNKALEIAVKEKLTFYDSLFLAVASKNKCAFITCDRMQARVARKLGVSVIEC